MKRMRTMRGERSTRRPALRLAVVAASFVLFIGVALAQSQAPSGRTATDAQRSTAPAAGVALPGENPSPAAVPGARTSPAAVPGASASPPFPPPAVASAAARTSLRGAGAPQADTIQALIGDLPDGETVTVVFDATVDSPLPTGVGTVSTQGTVSGTNFTSTLTDDPATGAVNDATVTVLDVPCLPILSPTSATVVSGGAIGNTFAVTAPPACTWAATESAPFISVTGGATGMGNGTVTYDVAANGTALMVSGMITVAGTTGDPTDGAADYTVNQQAAACTLNLNPPTSGPLASSGGASSFAVETLAGCNWSAASGDPDLTVTGGTAGTGPGTVDFSVVANPTALLRSLPVTVMVTNNGLTADHTTSQSASACTLALVPPSSSVPFGGGGGSFGVQTLAGCGWTASTADTEVTLTGATMGSGSGTVSFNVAANATAGARDFSVGVAVTGGTPSATHTISQAPAVCSFTFVPSSASYPGTGGSGSFAVDANAASCDWTPVSDADWLVVNGPANGLGDGNVSYTVLPSNWAVARQATIAVGEQSFTVQQEAGTCTYAIAPTALGYGLFAGANPITVDTGVGCTWSAVSNDDWISVDSIGDGVGPGIATIGVQRNESGDSRTGTVIIAENILTVTQSNDDGGAVALAPLAAAFPGVGGTGQLTVNAASVINWNAETDADWVTLVGAGGAGTGVVVYQVAPNPTAEIRTASINVVSRTFTVVQAPAGVSSIQIWIADAPESPTPEGESR